MLLASDVTILSLRCMVPDKASTGIRLTIKAAGQADPRYAGITFVLVKRISATPLPPATFPRCHGTEDATLMRMEEHTCRFKRRRMPELCTLRRGKIFHKTAQHRNLELSTGAANATYLRWRIASMRRVDSGDTRTISAL